MSDPHADFGHQRPKTPDKPIDPFDQCVADVLSQLAAGSGVVTPYVQQGVKTTVDFFHREVELKFREISTTWIGYIKGIDFHSRVAIEPLPAGTKLAQFRSSNARDKPFVYYTKPGNSQMILGTNFESYKYREVRLRQKASALRSRASDLAWDGISRPGGGMQFIISAKVKTKVTYASGLDGPRIPQQRETPISIPAWLCAP